MVRPVLQVALDLTELSRAEKIAEEAVAGGADWIEIGTPLVKSEGMESVRRMRDLFPTTTLVADLKTSDTGAIEVEMAAKAGANVVCVLAAARTLSVCLPQRMMRLLPMHCGGRHCMVLRLWPI